VAEALAAGTPCVVREAGALGDWADVTGCVGTGSVAPATVASRVREASERPVDVDGVWTPERVVEAVRDRYVTDRREGQEI
jgi:hypothetical protein